MSRRLLCRERIPFQSSKLLFHFISLAHSSQQTATSQWKRRAAAIQKWMKRTFDEGWRERQANGATNETWAALQSNESLLLFELKEADWVWLRNGAEGSCLQRPAEWPMRSRINEWNELICGAVARRAAGRHNQPINPHFFSFLGVERKEKRNVGVDWLKWKDNSLPQQSTSINSLLSIQTKKFVWLKRELNWLVDLLKEEIL